MSTPAAPAHEACTAESHAALKADDASWDALKSIGVARYDIDDGGPAFEVIDHRNCPKCGTTLVRVTVERGEQTPPRP